MNGISNDYSAIIESIQKTNDLLKLMAAAKLSIDDRMMKTDVVANVASGLGDNVDVEA